MKAARANRGRHYDEDFYRWTQETAELLRRGCFRQVDVEKVAEEIEDIGKRDRRELRSRMIVLLAHLLKWQAQPGRREDSSWKATIDEQRDQIALLLDDSPSLRQAFEEFLPEACRRAVRKAARETGIEQLADSQAACPWTIEQILSEVYFPA